MPCGQTISLEEEPEVLLELLQPALQPAPHSSALL
jgi:hypothetical protein